jgi:hypothetical protein
MARINAGTDIATIGIWDPTRDGHDLAGVASTEELRKRAANAELFFIDTGGDGGFPTEVIVDQDVPETLLRWMEKADGTHKLTCHSGRLVVGGLEDFVNEVKAIISVQDEITVKPGTYRLSLYQSRVEEDSKETEEEIIRRVGADDFAYYAKKGTGLGIGCLFVLAACVAPFLVHWLWSLALVGAGIAAFVIRQAMLLRDPRHKRVADAIAAFDDEIPAYAIHLELEAGDTPEAAATT